MPNDPLERFVHHQYRPIGLATALLREYVFLLNIASYVPLSIERWHIMGHL